MDISDYDYISNIIDLNPLEKVFPVTDKANQGISLDIWEKVLTDRKLSYVREDFIYLGSNRKGDMIRLI